MSAFEIIVTSFLYLSAWQLWWIANNARLIADQLDKVWTELRQSQGSAGT